MTTDWPQFLAGMSIGICLGMAILIIVKHYWGSQ